MRSKAYDYDGVVHLTDFKGAPYASCFDPEAHDPDTAPRVSPVFLTNETPVTCVKCTAIEDELRAQDVAKYSDEPDDGE